MNKITNSIYMDNSASTRMDEMVLEAMKPYFFDKYAVATSDFGYSMGIDAKQALAESRSAIARSINAGDNEIIFTSGFTESNNLAIKGVLKALKKQGKNHVISSTVEDFSVRNTLQKLEKEGIDVTFIPVDSKGFVDIGKLEKSINDKTALVTIQTANQEIGTLQDIEKIGEICRERDVYFHTDATHAYRRIDIDTENTKIDLITMDSMMIHGPRGMGALYARKGVELAKIMDGAFQEFDKRAGPENIPGAVGFAKAVELIDEKENTKIKEMADYLRDKLLSEIKDTTLNGSPDRRIPHNVNITFHYVEGESITLHLDMRGIAVSTGSACFSKSLEASHVIMGIGGDHERAHGSVRFTLSRFNTKKEIDAVVEAMKEIIENLRKISPLKKKE